MEEWNNSVGLSLVNKDEIIVKRYIVVNKKQIKFQKYIYKTSFHLSLMIKLVNFSNFEISKVKNLKKDKANE